MALEMHYFCALGPEGYASCFTDEEGSSVHVEGPTANHPGVSDGRCASP